MDLKKVKRLFLQILIACLVAAALVAVFAVLKGSFNNILGKALLTIVLVAVHSLISFSLIVNNERQDSFEKLTFFTNTTFVIIVLSFITSILGTWSVLHGDLVAKLYALYFVLLFAALHGEILTRTLKKQNVIDKLVYSNYIFMAIVVIMIIPVIFVSNQSSLSSMYYRSLSAAGIIDATLTLIIIILSKLYDQKHPPVVNPLTSYQPGITQLNAEGVPIFIPKKQHPIRNIFIGFLVFYVVAQLIFYLAIMFIGKL